MKGTVGITRKIAWVGLVLILIFLNFVAPVVFETEPSFLVRLISSCIILICGFFVIAQVQIAKTTIPFLQVWLCIFALYYGFSAFFFDPAVVVNRIALTEDEVVYSLLIALMSLFCFLTGYLGIVGFFNREWRELSKFDLELLEHNKLHGFSVIAGAIGLASLYIITVVEVPVRIRSVVDFLGSLSMFAIVVLYGASLSKSISRLLWVYLWGGLIPFRIILGMLQGIAGQVVYPIFHLFLAYLSLKKKVQLSYLLLLIFTFFVFQSLKKTDYREDVTHAQITTARVSLLNESIGNVLNPDDFVKEIQEKAVRFSGVPILCYIIYMIPRQVPFLGGHNIFALVTKPIPRFLWSNKPAQMNLNMFGWELGMLDEIDVITSVRPSHIGDLYANFGLAGVAVGMIISGAIASLIFHFISLNCTSLLWFSAGIVIAVPLLDIEGDIYATFGGLMWNFVMYYALSKFLTSPVRNGPHRRNDQ